MLFGLSQPTSGVETTTTQRGLQSERGADYEEILSQLQMMYPEASDELLEDAALTGDLNDALDVVCARLEGSPSSAPPPPPQAKAKRQLSNGDRDAIELVRARSGSTAACAAESDSSMDAALARMTNLLPGYSMEDLKVLLEICGDESDAVDVVIDAPWLVEPMVTNRWSRTHAEMKRMEECEAELKAKLNVKASSSNATSSGSTVRRTKDGWEIRCVVDKSRPCQSMRSNIAEPAERIMKEVGDDNTAAFAAICFEQMLQREQDLEGEFCVFYHAYNGAALMYEVQAEIARCAYGLDDSFAPLPRLFCNQFTGVTVSMLRNMLANRQTSDHDTRFRACAISATPSLFGYGSEAPPLQCFRAGYGCGDVSFRALLVGIINEGCGTTQQNSETIVDDICKVGAKYGLMVSNYTKGGMPCGGQSYNHQLGGQMLQIFVSLKEVEKLVYRSHAYGYPHEDQKRISEWLYPPASPDWRDPIDGQVRIVCRPDALVDPSRARIYHYCANWEFFGGRAEDEGSRAAFVQDLRKILEPVMNAHDVKKRVTAPGTGKSVPAAKPQPAPVAKVAVAPSPGKPPKSSGGGYPGGKKKGKKK